MPFDPIERAIETIEAGGMVIVVDDEDRENEGDLVIPAQWATPDAINFMAMHGRGLICLAMTSKRIEELGLELMSTNNSSRHETAFTVSIEAREGVTTGISAADRATTVRAAARSKKRRSRLSSAFAMPPGLKTASRSRSRVSRHASRFR